jgi:hypothetical protein
VPTTWRRAGHRWRPTPPGDAGTTATIEADRLWRLCVRMVDPADTGPAVRGDRELATAALTILAIIR